jgi:YegS/Rv2252/BmrU family lipid kinase
VNELISGPREPNTAAACEAVHVIVDAAHANQPELVSGLAAASSRLSCNLIVYHATNNIHTLARAVASGRGARVIVVGDDAAVNQAVGGLMSVDFARRPTLGIVPFGSLTETARDAGISHDVEQALIDAVVTPPRFVDVGRWGARWFLDLICGGALSETTTTTAESAQIMGGLAYAVAGVMGLPAMRPVDLAIRGESFEWSGTAYAVAIGNTRTIGGGFGLCPDASMVDGELDVTVVPASLDLTDILQLIDEHGVAGVAAVRRFRSPWVELRARSRIHLDIDNELRSCCRARFDLARGGLGVVLPPSTPLLEVATRLRNQAASG